MKSYGRFSFLVNSFFILILVFAVLADYTPVHAAGTGTFVFSPTTLTLSAGQESTLTVTINIASVQSPAADLLLSYNPSVITIVDILPGTAYAQYVGKAINNQTGSATISGLIPPGGQMFTGSGTFASVKVRAVAAGSSVLKIEHVPDNFNDSNIADFNLQNPYDVLGSVTNSTITVTGIGGGAPTATPTTRPGTPTPTVRPGGGGDDDHDFDDDGDDNDVDDDDDNDGVKDTTDDDDDNDGAKDTLDADDDNDTVKDTEDADHESNSQKNKDKDNSKGKNGAMTAAGILGFGALAAAGYAMFHYKKNS